MERIGALSAYLNQLAAERMLTTWTCFQPDHPPFLMWPWDAFQALTGGKPFEAWILVVYVDSEGSPTLTDGAVSIYVSKKARSLHKSLAAVFNVGPVRHAKHSEFWNADLNIIDVFIDGAPAQTEMRSFYTQG